VVRRTKDEAEATRNGILDAAETLFSKRGVSHTSLADIAEAAGVTRGAIYWHFEDKSDLFTAMVSRVTLPMEEMVARSSDESVADPLESLKAAAVYTLKRTARDPQCQRVLDVVLHKCEYVDDMAGVKRRTHEIQAGCVNRAEKAIRNAIRRGQLPAGLDARNAAIGLDAMIYGLISNWLANRDYIALEKQAEAVVELLFDGLHGAGRTRGATARRKRSAAKSKK